jgi:hypothetical protein
MKIYPISALNESISDRSRIYRVISEKDTHFLLFWFMGRAKPPDREELPAGFHNSSCAENGRSPGR